MRTKTEVKGISYDLEEIIDTLTPEEQKKVDEFYEINGRYDYLDIMYARNEQAEINWVQQGEENLKTLLAMQAPLVEQFKKKQAIAKSKGQEISYSGASYIGERISYLMKLNDQEVTEFSKNVGISRSSMHRYIKGSHLPSEKTLRKIIGCLFVDVPSFCYAPHSIDEWTKSFVAKHDEDDIDIFAYRHNILAHLSNNRFTYKNNGVKVRLPHRYFDLLGKLITASFEVLEMLPHDDK